MVKVEGVYRRTEKIGQELLYRGFTLPGKYREYIFGIIPEEFDYQCFISHMNYIKTNNLKGFNFVNIKPTTLVKFKDKILANIFGKTVLEIREDFVSDEILKKLARIREENYFLLSLDDFGTKASNFDRIKILKPDFIKLDMKILKTNRNEFLKLVEFLTSFSESVLIAEKVENEEDYELITSCGIEIWSGFYEKKLKHQEVSL